jgi:cytochrome c-type biogenesis protein CcmH/NrfG
VLDELRAAAIVTPVAMSFSGKEIPLVEHLLYDPGWTLAASDGAALLFLRRGAVSPEPAALDPRAARRLAAEEAARTLETYPEHAEAWLTLARARRRLGEAAAAGAAYRRALALRPDRAVEAEAALAKP